MRAPCRCCDICSRLSYKLSVDVAQKVISELHAERKRMSKGGVGVLTTTLFKVQKEKVLEIVVIGL